MKSLQFCMVLLFVLLAVAGCPEDTTSDSPNATRGNPQSTCPDDCSPVVPAPGAVVLGCLGVAAIGRMRIRRSR